MELSLSRSCSRRDRHSMANYQQRRIAAAGVTVLLTACGVWFAVTQISQREALPPADRDSQTQPSRAAKTRNSVLPRIKSSPYLNTTSRATYVGSAACRECHNDQYASFGKTPHSRALGPVDLKTEPPSAQFSHEKSGRTYRVYRQDGEFRHSGRISGTDISTGDFPVKYTIGSGHHSRSYLIEIDGFLVESPLTWYASKNAWKVSPGYDMPNHWSFTRPVFKGCVSCHAGRVESLSGTTHQIKFHEQRIGCENCHGPGSLHIETRRNREVSVEDKDLTIVQPAKLSRELNESICGRCHMGGAASVNVRGRSIDDFRPGLRLTDFKVHYRKNLPDDAMTVVGHFEQMRRSKCYTRSNSMTCTTCHNPHDSPDESDKVASYRKTCLSCHESDGGCKLPEKRRLAQNPANNCIACHMPKSGTDIPHFAFTHHRIGLNHKTDYNNTSPRKVVDLVPLGDVSRLSKHDRERCLALAEILYADKRQDEARRVYFQRAAQRLQSVHAAGIRDAEVLAALARVHWELQSEKCIEYAESALLAEGRTAATNVNALIVLGDTRFKQEKFGKAARAFQRLTKIRRWASDWQMMGLALLKNGNPSGALRAIQKAVAIRPDRIDLHLLLAQAAEQSSDFDTAKKHRTLAGRIATAVRRQDRSPPDNP